MVNIDTVAIANLKIVQKVDAVDDSLVASDEMHSPVSSFTNSDIPYCEIPYISKCQHMRTRVKSLVCKRLEFIGITELGPHERYAITMNGALAGDADVIGIICINPHHSFAPVLSKST